MKKFYFLAFIFIVSNYIINAQSIWPRTYSGYKDAATNGVEDNERNLYIVGSNGSAQNQVTSEEEPAFSENSGAFVTKLDPDGNTIWYTDLTPNYNFAGSSRILYRGNDVYALFKGKIYKLKADTGSLVSIYDTNNDNTLPDRFISDFAIYEGYALRSTSLVLITKYYNNNNSYTYIKILQDNGTNFVYQNHIQFTSSTPSYDGKIMISGNDIYYGTLYYNNAMSNASINYPVPGGANGSVDFSNDKRYVLYNYDLTYNASTYNFTFNNILNQQTEDYPIDDFDIDKDPALGENLIYGTGRGTNNGKLYTVFADDFSNQHDYDVNSGDKTAFSAHNGKVYYGILDTSSTPYTNNFYGGDINTIDLVFENGWGLFADCFHPMWTIDSTIADTLYPIGYYGPECSLGNVHLPSYHNTGVKSIVARLVENANGAEFERTDGQQVNPPIEVELSPNPAISYVNIKLNKEIKGSIKVVNNLHQVSLSRQNIELNNFNINVSSWRKGNYFIQITTDNGQIYNKQLMVH